MLFWIIIGAAFYNLAKSYNKNKFLYLGVGVGLTLLTQLIVGLVYGLIFRPSQEEIEDKEFLINIVALIISGIITYIVYRALKNKVEREHDEKLDFINSIGADIKESNLPTNE
jgi:zinc transporter ZupT